jgi:hypothetical protein
MAIPLELVRVLNKMEGEIAEAAKEVVRQQRFSSEASRSQFKLAVEGAQQSEDLRLLQAFLAYQASRDEKVWGHQRDNSLFVQKAWARLQQQIQSYESNAQANAREAWRQVSDEDKQTLQRMVAERFFAHIERAFEIWKDNQARDFYFGPLLQQGQPTPTRQGGSQHGA